MSALTTIRCANLKSRMDAAGISSRHLADIVGISGVHVARVFRTGVCHNTLLDKLEKAVNNLAAATIATTAVRYERLLHDLDISTSSGSHHADQFTSLVEKKILEAKQAERSVEAAPSEIS